MLRTRPISRKSKKDHQDAVERPRPTPFLKWAGGKGQLLLDLKEWFPSRYVVYHEPFLGGGAVFFDLQPERAILNDLNEELMGVYRVVQSEVELLIDELHKHDLHKADEPYYYKVRDQDPSLHDPVKRAARTIFLNKTCFNGLYRVNSKGKFNVPFGGRENPLIIDEANLRACSAALKRALLKCGDHRDALAYARRGDFVYLDPPYHPVSKTANFTSYTKEMFSEADQMTLANGVKTLHEKGVKFLLSNSPTSLVRKLYSDFEFAEVEASRLISSRKETRGKVKELLIMNYALPQRKLGEDV